MSLFTTVCDEKTPPARQLNEKEKHNSKKKQNYEHKKKQNLKNK